MYKRGFTKKELSGLAILKQSKLSFKIGYNSGGKFTVDVPELKTSYFLDQIMHFQKDYNNYKNSIEPKLNF